MPNLITISDKNPLIANLVGWWRMDEGTGSAVADSSGNSYDCTLANSTWVTGYNGVGYAIAPTDLDGRASRTSASANLDMSTNNISYSFWLYLVSEPTTLIRYVFRIGTDGNLFSCGILKDRTEGSGYEFLSTVSGQKNGTQTSALWFSYGLSTGLWYHVIFTINRSTRETRLYCNGIYQSSQNLSSALDGATVTSTGEVHIGSTPSGANDRHVPGYIRDLRVYNGTLLSANEVMYLYNVPR